MKDLKELIKDVERDLVVGIVISVKHKRISLSESKVLAREFLEKPYKSYDELFQKLFELGKKYKEVRKIYVKYAPEFEYLKTEEALKIVRNYIHFKNYDSAIRFAKENYGN